MLPIRRPDSILSHTPRPLPTSSIMLCQHLLAGIVRGSAHPSNQVLLLRTRMVLPLTLTDVNFVGEKACENPQDSTSTSALPLVVGRLPLSWSILLGLAVASATWAKVNQARCIHTLPQALVRLVACMSLALWGPLWGMGTCVELPPQRRGVMHEQVALWVVQGCLGAMELETSVAGRRRVSMALEARKRLPSMASGWLEELAEMLERTAKRSGASGQCFAADEGCFLSSLSLPCSFLPSFTLDDYDRPDDHTLHYLESRPGLTPCVESTASRSIEDVICPFYPRPGDDTFLTNATKTCPWIFPFFLFSSFHVVLLVCLVCLVCLVPCFTDQVLTTLITLMNNYIYNSRSNPTQ